MRLQLVRSLAGIVGLALLAGPQAAFHLQAPARAQDQAPVPFNQIRALNLARSEAVRINGGLSVYRPANCMFRTSDADNPCLVRNNAEGFTFRFTGGPPGWEVKGISPTVETDIQISADGRKVVGVAYNGKPR